MKSTKLLILSWVFMFVCILLGGFLGMYLIGKETGESPFDLAIPIIGGTVGGFLIYFIIYSWNKKRTGNVPDFDERSVKLMTRYFMFVLYVVLFGSGAGLIILYSLGVQFIETGMLIICLMGLYILIGFGVIVTKRL